MKTFTTLLLFFNLLFIAACANQQPSALATNEDEDFGIGGTGIIASNSQGSGIIGMITGYGSIFINGIEIETDNKAAISIDGIRVQDHDFEIGEVAEVLTVDSNAHSQAQHINMRHEIIGPVSSYDARRATAVILGQTVNLSKLSPGEISTGDRLAIAGFTDHSGLIHATHIRRSTDRQILLRGKIHSDASALSINGLVLTGPAEQISASENYLIHGSYQNGVITAHSIQVDPVLAFNKVSRWVIQGYTARYAGLWDLESIKPAGATDTEVMQFQVNNPDSASTSIKLLSQQQLMKGAMSKPQMQQKNTPLRSISPGRQTGSSGHGKH